MEGARDSGMRTLVQLFKVCLLSIVFVFRLKSSFLFLKENNNELTCGSTILSEAHAPSYPDTADPGIPLHPICNS